MERTGHFYDVFQRSMEKHKMNYSPSAIILPFLRVKVSSLDGFHGTRESWLKHPDDTHDFLLDRTLNCKVLLKSHLKFRPFWKDVKKFSAATRNEKKERGKNRVYLQCFAFILKFFSLWFLDKSVTKLLNREVGEPHFIPFSARTWSSSFDFSSLHEFFLLSIKFCFAAEFYTRNLIPLDPLESLAH